MLKLSGYAALILYQALAEMHSLDVWTFRLLSRGGNYSIELDRLRASDCVAKFRGHVILAVEDSLQEEFVSCRLDAYVENGSPIMLLLKGESASGTYEKVASVAWHG